MTTAQRDAIDAILRTRPFDPAGDPLEQRGRFGRVVTAAPVPADVVTTPGDLGGGCRCSRSRSPG